MSNFLHRLLGIEGRLSSISLDRLERFCSEPSIDVRLTAEMAEKSRLAKKHLGLDPNDTTAEELYGAVQSLAERHVQMLGRRFGWDKLPDQDSFMHRLAEIVNHSGAIDKPVWVIKRSRAKTILKAVPPKNVAKQLGYRSVDSLIKRESPGKILALAGVVESPAWHKRLRARYQKLGPLDFEEHKIEVSVAKPRQALKEASPAVVSLEAGAICLLPVGSDLSDATRLVLLLELIGLVNRVRETSSRLKLHQAGGGFGSALAGIDSDDTRVDHEIARHTISHSLLHRHLSDYEEDMLQELVPHMSKHDFAWTHAEEVLARFEPALHFWRDFGVVGTLPDGQPLSFNLHDALFNLIHRRGLSDRAFHNLSAVLEQEILARYMRTPAASSQTINRLNRQLAPVTIDV